jgi:hypothetical protein
MKLQKAKALLLSLFPILSTAALIPLSAVTMPFIMEQPAHAESSRAIYALTFDRSAQMNGSHSGLGNPSTNVALTSDPMNGWKIEGGDSNLLEGKKYSFFNTDQKSYLRYKDRTGANLGWSGNPNNFMMVKRENSSAAPIKCEEPIGLFIEKEWLMYEKQTFGINISTRTKLNNPGWYQWKFTNCGGGESVVKLNRPISLVNTQTGATVVGCERMVGVNLCWAEDVITFRGKNYRKEDIKTLVKYGKVAAEILSVL